MPNPRLGIFLAGGKALKLLSITICLGQYTRRRRSISNKNESVYAITCTVKIGYARYSRNEGLFGLDIWLLVVS